MGIHPRDPLIPEPHSAALSMPRATRPEDAEELPGSILAGRLSEVLGRAGASTDYSAVFDRLEATLATTLSQVETERAAAPDLLAELLAEDPEGQEAFLRSEPRLHLCGLLELLIERSRERAFPDPPLGERLARLALVLADLLDGERYGTALLADLKARGWGFVANARRVSFDLAGADAAFAIAFDHLGEGTRDPMERGVLLDLKASLRRDQRRFEEAQRLLTRAVDVFQAAGETHRAGRSLVNLASVHHNMGQPEISIPMLSRALACIDRGREPRLELSAQHNLILCLTEAGRFVEARASFVAAAPVYERFPDAWTRNRRNWLEGKIARGLGNVDEAEALFVAARDGFLAEGIPYDTALVSLDLAGLYAEQGRAAELRKVAERMVVIFASRQIHREALLALSFLRQAVDTQRATIEVVTGIASYLERARHDPALRFDLPFPFSERSEPGWPPGARGPRRAKRGGRMLGPGPLAGRPSSRR